MIELLVSAVSPPDRALESRAVQGDYNGRLWRTFRRCVRTTRKSRLHAAAAQVGDSADKAAEAKNATKRQVAR